MSLMNVVFPILFRMFMVILGLYFLSEAIFRGNNSLFKLFAYQKELPEGQEQLEELQQKNRKLENKIALFNSDNPDCDLREEVYLEKSYILVDDCAIIPTPSSPVRDKVDQD